MSKLKAALGLSAALTVLLAAPGSAGAASVFVLGGGLVYSSDGPSQANDVSFQPGADCTGFGGPCVDITDTGEAIGIPLLPCAIVFLGPIRCPAGTGISVDVKGGDDTVTFGSGLTNPTFTTAGPGDDTLNGGGGDDTFTGNAGADEFNGGAGADTVSYADRSDTDGVVAGIGGGADDGSATDGPAGARDAIGSDVEHLTGGAGPDQLDGSGGVNRIDGGGGHDTIHGLGGGDTPSQFFGWNPATCLEISSTQVGGLIGGAGNDVIVGGETGRDRLEGGPGNDELQGLGGDDLLFNTGAADTCMGAAVGSSSHTPAGLYGGEGDDDLDGGSGDDRLEGGGGADELSGGLGRDASYMTISPPASLQHEGGLLGGADADSLDGGLGPDELSGGEGTDEAYYGGRINPVTVDPGGGADDGAPNEDEQSGPVPGRDDIGTDVENLTGGSADDVLTGDAQANVLKGNAGADTLAGNDGPDTLIGDAGVDGFDAGAGSDEVQAQDGLAEAILCGPDLDTLLADEIDTAGADCEQIQLPPKAGAPPAGNPSATAKRKCKKGRKLKKGKCVKRKRKRR